MSEKKKIILLDSNAIIHRAFHALPPLSTKSGILTNAVYGYALALMSVLEKFQPESVVATFDLPKPTFRHLKYGEYKANRKKAPDELYSQIPLVKDLVRAFGIPIIEKEGFEADDIIGTLAKSQDLAEFEKIIVTGDLDALQLVDEKTKVYVFRKGIKDAIFYDKKAVEERFGLSPLQLKSYKGLRGDTSDNIPGVKGIGEKTAITLIRQFGDLEGVYSHLEEISSLAVRKKIQEDRERAFLSYELGEIKIDVPLERFSVEDCLLKKKGQKEKILEFFSKMEFYSLAKRFSKKELIDQEKKLEKKKTFKIIDSKEEAEKLFQEIEKNKVIFLAPHFFEEKFFGWGVSISENQNYFLSPQEDQKFIAFFSRKDILKVGHNLKELMLFCEKEKKNTIRDWENFIDLQVIFYLLKPEAKNDWESLLAIELGEDIEKKKKNSQISLFSIEEKKASEEDFLEIAKKAWQTFRLFQLVKEKISELNWEIKKPHNFFSLKELSEKVELPLIKVLAKMEKTGFLVDKEKLQKTSQKAEKILSQLEQEIFALAGEKFNVNSPLQLAEILFQKLKLSTVGIKKGKIGFSTDAEQLGKLRAVHPIIEKIEKFREIAKLKNTYADALPLSIKDDNRIHAHFNQALTATGRLSCDNPNLQNIPKKGELADEIRQAFIADKDYKLLSVDYSQIDLRVAAHLSKDDRMIQAFCENKDIHRITASWVNGIPEKEVSSEQRSEAKSLNFGVLYGMGTYGFMRDSGVSRKRAEFFIAEYMRKFSGLKNYLEKIKKEARKKGFLETQMGRRRYISGFEKQFGGAERMAVNFPIQGLAADIMKLAMVKVFEDFPVLWEAKEIRLVLQVHDELIFEVKEDLADAWAEKIKNSMEKVFPLAVPLSAEVETGNTWAEL